MKPITVSIIAAVLLAGTSLALSETEPQAPSTQPAATQPSPNDVLAKIGDKTLTRGDMEAMKQALRIPEYAPVSMIVQNWIDTHLLLEEGKRRKLDKDPKVALAMKLVADRQLAQMTVQAMQDDLVATEKELLEYYEEHKTEKRFTESDVVDFMFIATPDAEQMDQVKARLDEGEEFAELAREYETTSLDLTGLPSYKIEGATVEQLRQDVDPSFGYSLYRAEKGVVSEPKQFGKEKNQVIFYITEKKAGAPKPFDQVKETIQNIVEREKKNNGIREAIEAMREKADIFKAEEVLDAEQQQQEQAQNRPAPPQR